VSTLWGVWSDQYRDSLLLGFPTKESAREELDRIVDGYPEAERAQARATHHVRALTPDEAAALLADLRRQDTLRYRAGVRVRRWSAQLGLTGRCKDSCCADLEDRR
jgi:hypothetical protein